MFFFVFVFVKNIEGLSVIAKRYYKQSHSSELETYNERIELEREHAKVCFD